MPFKDSPKYDPHLFALKNICDPERQLLYCFCFTIYICNYKCIVYLYIYNTDTIIIDTLAIQVLHWYYFDYIIEIIYVHCAVQVWKANK